MHRPLPHSLSPPPAHLQPWALMASGSGLRRWWSGCCAPTLSPMCAPTLRSSQVCSEWRHLGDLLRLPQASTCPPMLLPCAPILDPHCPTCLHPLQPWAMPSSGTAHWMWCAACAATRLAAAWSPTPTPTLVRCWIPHWIPSGAADVGPVEPGCWAGLLHPGLRFPPNSGACFGEQQTPVHKTHSPYATHFSPHPTTSLPQPC